MDRPQLNFRLRIAVSVLFAAVTMALCALLVRSYWRSDHVTWPNSSGWLTHVSSSTGQWEVIYASPNRYNRGRMPPKLEFWRGLNPLNDPTKTLFSVFWESNADGWRLNFPQLLPLVLAGILAALPIGLHARFSLRNLMIATAIVAVMLGLGVWSGL